MPDVVSAGSEHFVVFSYPGHYVAMEDAIEIILENHSFRLFHLSRDRHTVTLWMSGLLSGFYGLWAMFCMPGLKVPFRLKVPFLPSTKEQTSNVMRLLQGRTGRLADLGSGDGRLVFEASSVGFQCTGFEINSILLAYSRGRAWWRGIPHTQATFVKKDFWKTDLSLYKNVTVFLAPAVMGDLEKKLQRELPADGRVVVCRFPFPHWPHTCSVGEGLNQVWAYDMSTVPKACPLRFQ